METPRTPATSSFAGLEKVVALLRGKNGCPWDQKQTPESLKKYLREECRELAEAIDQGDPREIAGEIGDLLFVLALLMAAFAERRDFTADEVFAGIIAKMVRRHPHVFAGSPLPASEAELAAQWERIKSQEKQALQPVQPLHPEISP